MKKIIGIISAIVVLQSCSTTYYGNVTYYMPDGTTENYKAYVEDFHDGRGKTVYCDWGDGVYMITSGIPYKFIGSANSNNPIEENYISCYYNGKDYEIPKKVWDSIQTISTENGRLNKERAKELLGAYIIKNFINKPKFIDGVYNN